MSHDTPNKVYISPYLVSLHIAQCHLRSLEAGLVMAITLATGSVIYNIICNVAVQVTNDNSVNKHC